MTDGTEQAEHSWRTWVPLALATLGVLAWLWPIGLGGKMPVGGDVTQFSIGLMAELGRAIRAGRIPFWNDLWGYGFPGLAESQMGVYYPPHLLAYGLLPLEAAYTLLLVGHTLWATWGGYWASRQFGSSRAGAAISGFAFGTCGFFLVHIPHQWGASTACWMPWAWGLAWRVGSGTCRPRARLWLAAVLAVQILPGHFQLAFITEVTTCLIGLAGILSRRQKLGKRLLGFAVPIAAVLPLALMQLAPTAELASLAKEQRTVDYLGAFASPPTHLISYVAPGLFHQSQLWRPLVWDAFHAMPEEHLATIGLVPLFLAILALRKWREPAVIALVVAGLAATIFSFGPYVPGFSTYCQWPGFSFFRAPARWGAGAMLALALLAGRGWDAFGLISKPEWPLRWFVVLAGVLLALVIGLFELALAATEPVGGKPSMPGVVEVFDGMFTGLPFENRSSFAKCMAEARQTQADLRVEIALARQGDLRLAVPADFSLPKSRGDIYSLEIGPTLTLLGGLLALSFFAEPRRVFLVGLLVLMATESGIWSRKRVYDLGPIQDLRVQSTLLGELAKLPRATRSIDPGKNLSIVAGVANLGAYRTLDLPVLPLLTSRATGGFWGHGMPAVWRALGVGVVVVEPGGLPLLQDWENITSVDDPVLMGWLTSEAWVKSVNTMGTHKGWFGLWKPKVAPVQAWLITGDEANRLLPTEEDRVTPLDTSWAKMATPVKLQTLSPEHVIAEFDASEPGTFVNMSLYYPRWRATLNGKPVPVAKRFGCPSVNIPAAGHYLLELRYDATRDYVALAISGLAWMGWILLYWASWKRQMTDAKEQAR